MSEKTDRKMEVIEQIELLLKAQKEAVRKGELKVFERFVEQVGALICVLKEEGSCPNKQQLEKLQKLYDEIKIVVEAEKAKINKEIKQTREHGKLLDAYGQK